MRKKLVLLGFAACTLTALVAWEIAWGAGCDDLRIYEIYPFEATYCDECTDVDQGVVWNWGYTQLTCLYLEYDSEDNIKEDDTYPDVWFGGDQALCAYVPPMEEGDPGEAYFTVFSIRIDWTQSAFMRINLSYPCAPPFKKSIDAYWIPTCPYCN